MNMKMKSTLAALSLAILAVTIISGCASSGGGFGGGASRYHRAWSGNGPHGGNIGR